MPERAVIDALVAWGEVWVGGRLGGGNRNTVLEIRRGGQRLVARRSRREPASLDWEARLLDHLAGQGLLVPRIVPALDGRRYVAGVMVQSWLDGGPPGPGDWPAVAVALRRVHEVTAGWPQRPGFASIRELLSADWGGDVHLAALPAEAVTACRRAWAGLAGCPEAVVHGDPCPANIRITPAGAGLLDWDEARVDSTALDLADLPAARLPQDRAGRCPGGGERLGGRQRLAGRARLRPAAAGDAAGHAGVIGVCRPPGHGSTHSLTEHRDRGVAGKTGALVIPG